MFAHLKLRNRMLLGYSIPVVLMIGLAGFIYANTIKVNSTVKNIDRLQDVISKTDEMTVALTSLGADVRGYTLNVDPSFLEENESDWQRFIRNKEHILQKLYLTQKQQKIFNKMLEVGESYHQQLLQAIDLVEQGRQNEAVAVVATSNNQEDLLDQFDKLNEELSNLMEKELAAASNEVDSANSYLYAVLTLGTLITAALAAATAYLISGSVTKTLTQASSAIASSSTEIAITVKQQERTVSQQASSVTQTSTTMDELGASSRQSAEQAEASASGARQALSLAEDGTKAVEETLEGMSTLKDKVGAIAKQILRLSEQTQQIGGISGLVGDLANQTNMLALNAAVEAARAGEHGKGFGVVAGEIRKLADQSKKSAEKINALVGDIQTAINTTVMVTDEGTKTVDSGMKLTQSTAQTFTGVADAVNNVFLNSQQISLSAKRQAVAVQQVVAAMNAINLGAKETASGITQVKTSTEQLKDAAYNLKALV